MKKNLLILICAVSFINTIIAQPTLTSAQNPIVGDIFVYNTTNYVSPGSSGASQNWNLSSMTVSATKSYTVMNAASTPSGSSFPSANIATSDGTNYGYYQTSASSYLNQGNIAGGVVFSYTNTEVLLNYPCNYTNSTIDSWGCSYTNGLTFSRYGTSTITADGYGTLTTPAGTYTNVMRVHVIQAYKDSAISFPIIINYVNDQYFWYGQGIRFPLASVFSFTTTSSSTSTVTTGGGYLSSFTTGLNELSFSLSGFNLFPNPAVNSLNLRFNCENTMESEVRVYNITGQNVMNNTVSVTKGINDIKLDVSELPFGVYYLQLKNKDAVLRNEKFTIVH